MEIRTLSPEATKEILGDDLSFLVAFSSTGDPILYTADGKKAEEKAFPVENPANVVLGTNSLTAVRGTAKCWVLINGIWYCFPC